MRYLTSYGPTDFGFDDFGESASQSTVCAH